MQDGDLISRKALLEEYEWLMKQAPECNKPMLQEHIDRINRQPAVDAEPVRHEKWQKEGGIPSCSVCHNEAETDHHDRFILSRYCPNCGAELGGAE